jgi:hypothetical protein
MSSDLDDLDEPPREAEPAVPPHTDGNEDRPVADEGPVADTTADGDREVPDA